MTEATKDPTPAGSPGAAGSATLPYVLAFAEQMEQKLAANRHKGDRDGWMSNDARTLLGMLLEEVIELTEAVRAGDPGEVVAEAADVANFAMMVADRVGGLSPNAQGEPRRTTQ